MPSVAQLPAPSARVQVLSSNAYSFSRVIALLVSSLIAMCVFGDQLTATFACGAVLVCLSGWIYREPGAPDRWLRSIRSTTKSMSRQFPMEAMPGFFLPATGGPTMEMESLLVQTGGPVYCRRLGVVQGAACAT